MSIDFDNQMLDESPARRGDWIATFTGRKVYPLDLRPEDIDIRDIAHALSMKCRFGGHSSAYFSVAEHSIYVSRLVPTEFKLVGLLHDASEAYLADIPRPVKPHIPGWRDIERNVDEAIATKFRLPYPFPEILHEVDARICLTEGELLLGGTSSWELAKEYVAIDQRLMLWPPFYAEKVFLREFERLTGEGW